MLKLIVILELNEYFHTFLCHPLVAGQKHFDSLIRKVLYGANEQFPRPKYFSLNRGQMFPEKMTIMDYRFDDVENWWPWLRSEECVLPKDALISEIIVPTKETGYITYWLDLCLKKEVPIILIGPTGTGKSAIVTNHLLSLPKNSYVLNVVNFSARTGAELVSFL